MFEKRIYAVTAATGHIGERVAHGLLQAGHQVRALGRDANKLKGLGELGATPMLGDLRDAPFVDSAFRGAHAAFLVVPPNPSAPDFRRYFTGVAANYAAAARATGLKHALFISTLGTHDEKYRGLIAPHADVEKSLDAVAGLNVLHLRAPSFFENLFYFMPGSVQRGALASAIAPDAPLETAAKRDIAAVALRLLLELSFRQSSAVEVHGPQGLTMRKVAALIEKELGRPFPAERVKRDDDIAALVSMGTSRDFATLLNDTWDIFSQHGLIRAEEPTAASSMPTAMEEFIRQELVPVLTAPGPLVDRGTAVRPVPRLDGAALTAGRDRNRGGLAT